VFNERKHVADEASPTMKNLLLPQQTRKQHHWTTGGPAESSRSLVVNAKPTFLSAG
jgi:hypothetical protein